MTFSVLTQLFLTVFADTIREMYKEDRRRMRIVWEYCDMPGTLLAKYTKTGYPLMLSYRFYASVQEKITDPDNMHKRYMQQIMDRFDANMESAVTSYIITAVQHNINAADRWQMRLFCGNQLLRVIFELLNFFYKNE